MLLGEAAGELVGLGQRPRVQPHDRVARGDAVALDRDERLPLGRDADRMNVGRLDVRMSQQLVHGLDVLVPVRRRGHLDHVGRRGEQGVLARAAGDELPVHGVGRALEGGRAEVETDQQYAVPLTHRALPPRSPPLGSHRY